MTLATGARLGPYEITALIGEGGMGQVYRALDTRLGRTVAIKILPPYRASSHDFDQRFAREARAVSSLTHPNICAIFDVGETRLPREVWSGRPVSTGEDQTIPLSYFVMEHLQGSSLRERLMRGRILPLQAIEIAQQLAAGLAAAHDRGLLHRDLKPANVFITTDDVLKILDFGVAKVVMPDEDEPTVAATDPGALVGTAPYMSPEQIRGAGFHSWQRHNRHPPPVVRLRSPHGRGDVRAVAGRSAILSLLEPASSLMVGELKNEE